jgi:phage tail sheath protein FI
MTDYEYLPGVKVKEITLAPPPIAGVSTSTAGFVGVAPDANVFKDTGLARLVTSPSQFKSEYAASAKTSTPLSRAVLGFFANGGSTCYVINVGVDDPTEVVKGIKTLETVDDVSIIAAPGYPSLSVYSELSSQAERLHDRFALLETPAGKKSVGELVKIVDPADPTGARPPDSMYAAFYYPRILVAKEFDNDPAAGEFVTPVGHIAGLYARVDSARGVHKAPANEALWSVLGVEQALSDDQQNSLNYESVNALRLFSGNVVVWGARTLQASTNTQDALYHYINVRRMVTYIEKSLKVGLRWAVFEPNNLTLQKQITRAVHGFLDGIWRAGGLFGATAEEAYYVRFPDADNTIVSRSQGRLVMEVGLSVTYPAEFIIINIGIITQNAIQAQS